MSKDTYTRRDANTDDCNLLERLGGFKGTAVETPVTKLPEVKKSNASNKKG